MSLINLVYIFLSIAATIATIIYITIRIISIYKKKTNLRNRWLKYHYDEIVKSMDNPYMLYNLPLYDKYYKSLRNFKSGFLNIIDNNIYKFKVSDDYKRYFITDENLYQHLKSGYKSTFSKLKEATNIEELNNYAANLNEFISNIKDKTEGEIKKFAPKIEPTNNYNPNKCGYILTNIISIILTQIYKKVNKNEAKPPEFIKNKLNNSMLEIKCNDCTAITVSTNLPELDNLIDHLNNIYKDFIECGNELYE